VYAITQTGYRELTALHSAALGDQAACITALLQHSAGTGAQAGADQSHAVSLTVRSEERGAEVVCVDITRVNHAMRCVLSYA